MAHFAFFEGVVDDGSPLAPHVPARTGKTVLAPRGGTLVVRVQVVTNSGVPVDLKAFTGLTAPLTVRDSSDPQRARVSKAWAATILAGRTDTLAYELAPADTRLWSTGRYFFDIWLRGTLGSTAVAYQIVEPSVLVLVPSLA